LPGASHILILLDAAELSPCSSTSGSTSASSSFPRLVSSSTAITDDSLDKNNTSMAALALQACESVVREQIRTLVQRRTGRRDGFGLYLYNTRYRERADLEMPPRDHAFVDTKEAGHGSYGDEEDGDPENEDEEEWFEIAPTRTTCHELIPLVPPGVDTIKRIQYMMNGDGLQKLEQLYADSTPQDNSDTDLSTYRLTAIQFALREVVRVFKTAKCIKKRAPSKVKVQAPDFKQVWIFTSQADPTYGNADMYDLVQTLVQDATENDIEFLVIPYPNVQADQDFYAVYSQLRMDFPLWEDTWDDTDQWKEMVASIRQHWKKTRRAFGVPLLMPDWESHPHRSGCLLDFYRLVQCARIPAPVPIHSETGRYVFTIVPAMRVSTIPCCSLYSTLKFTLSFTSSCYFSWRDPQRNKG
jgi:hypothetical protein